MSGKVPGGRRRGRQFNVRAADDKDLERRGHSDMVQHDVEIRLRAHGDEIVVRIAVLDACHVLDLVLALQELHQLRVRDVARHRQDANLIVVVALEVDLEEEKSINIVHAFDWIG